MPELSGVLLDVGGTLWPDRLIPGERDLEDRLRSLMAALPWISRETGTAFIEELRTRGEAMHPIRQDCAALIREVAEARGLPLGDTALAAVRRAMCLPCRNDDDLFPRARGLLATIKALGLSCAIVSNATWRDGEAYRRDFDALGLTRFVDGFISSVDVGYRKPHPAMFETALTVIGHPAGACACIGNSEQNDIEPALALHMRTIRVAIEEPAPERSAAHAIARSLHETAEILRSWVWAD